MICFLNLSIHCLVCWMSESRENAHHDSPQLKVTSSNVLFCPICRFFHLRQQTDTFEKLDSADVWLHALKMTEIMGWIWMCLVGTNNAHILSLYSVSHTQTGPFWEWLSLRSCLRQEYSALTHFGFSVPSLPLHPSPGETLDGERRRGHLLSLPVQFANTSFRARSKRVRWGRVFFFCCCFLPAWIWHTACKQKIKALLLYTDQLSISKRHLREYLREVILI